MHGVHNSHEPPAVRERRAPRARVADPVPDVPTNRQRVRAMSRGRRTCLLPPQSPRFQRSELLLEIRNELRGDVDVLDDRSEKLIDRHYIAWANVNLRRVRADVADRSKYGGHFGQHGWDFVAIGKALKPILELARLRVPVVGDGL